MTATTNSESVSPLLARRVSTRRVLRGAVVAALMATVAVELYARVLQGAGVVMKAGFVGAATASRLTDGSFAIGVLVCTFWGAVLATVLAKTATQPATTFRRLAVALTAISLLVPIGAGATAASTKIALAGAHIVVAAIVIPTLTRYLRPAASDKR